MNAYFSSHRTFERWEAEAIMADPLWRGRVMFSQWLPPERRHPDSCAHGASLSYKPQHGETWQDAVRRFWAAERDSALMRELHEGTAA